MTGPAELPDSWVKPRRRWVPWRGLTVAAVVVVAVVVGVFTDGFGIPGLLQPHGTGPTGPGGSNPNPYDENITAVEASIAYGGAAQPFPALEGTDLCPHCPALPTVNAAHEAGFWFYFNVTNIQSSTGATLANFSISTSGYVSTVFVLVHVLCCYTNHYAEFVSQLYFPPSQSYGLAAYVTAVTIPYDATGGYVLYFNSTSP